MGRTILSATQTWVEEEKALMRYVRALRKSDQDLVQELLAFSRQHIAEASYAGNLYPMDIYLISMLLEMFKKVKQLEHRLEEHGVQAGVEKVNTGFPVFPTLLELVSPIPPPIPVNFEMNDTADLEYVDVQDGA